MDAWMNMEFHVGDEPPKYLTVRQWPEAPDCVEVCTVNCEDYYGDQSIVMYPEMARKMAAALLKMANHIEAEEK